MNKRALIVGLNSPDGFLLTQILLEHGFTVEGFSRRSLDKVYPFNPSDSSQFSYFQGDVGDPIFVARVLARESYDLIFYLAAQSFIGLAEALPLRTVEPSSANLLYFLEILKGSASRQAVFSFFSSSEAFGKLSESDVLVPNNSYGLGKKIGTEICRYFAERHELDIKVFHLYNHESIYRPTNFLVPKVVLGIKELLGHRKQVLKVGNMESKRDWGDASDFMQRLVEIASTDVSNQGYQEYLLFTGVQTSVKEIIKRTFQLLDVPVCFNGIGVSTHVTDATTGQVLVESSAEFYRSTDEVSDAATILNKTTHPIIGVKCNGTVLDVIDRLIGE